MRQPLFILTKPFWDNLELLLPPICIPSFNKVTILYLEHGFYSFYRGIFNFLFIITSGLICTDNPVFNDNLYTKPFVTESSADIF